VNRLTLAILVNVLLVSDLAAGEMYKCENNVMTDRPTGQSGCVNMRTKETYESELSKQTQVDSKPVFAPIPRSDKTEWYSGGNLHKLTVGEWKRGTPDNRLATASDFAATILKGQFSSMVELKYHASELETCITRSVSEVEINHEKINSIAAACAILMGWKSKEA
jgi:hypothetical protein